MLREKENSNQKHNIHIIVTVLCSIIMCITVTYVNVSLRLYKLKACEKKILLNAVVQSDGR